MTRLCKFCGLPLPEGCARQRRLHAGECIRLFHNQKMKEYGQNTRPRRGKKKETKPEHGPHYDPMQGLGMDYVALKLAGKIRPLPKERQQITLHDF